VTTIRYWAALKQAAGVAEEQVAAPSLSAALDEVRGRHDARFAEVLARCSLLVDGEQLGTRDPATVALAEVREVDCLPPFAGG
jgi:molybdopterin converting factor small subunit